MVEAITNKGGENVIETSLRRNAQGLLVTIKTHPRVEEFMIRLSGGDKLGVTTVGRHWMTELTDPVTGEKHVINPIPLQAYQLYTPIDPFLTNDGTRVNLDRLGHQIYDSVMNERTGAPEEQLNMSYLRLVGISREGGVQFLLRSVHSLQGMKKLRDVIQNAQNTFYTDYIRTVEYCVTTATQTV